MPMIYSTLTNDSAYVEYHKGANDIPQIVREVIIQGGAGVARRKTLVTPYGVGTEVNDDVLTFLKADDNFKRHMKSGWLKIVEKGKPDGDVISADMAQRDGSSPLVPNDFAEARQPTTGSEKPVTEPTTKKRTKPAVSAFR